MSTTALVGRTVEFPRNQIPPCDGTEDGGYTGTLSNFDVPIWGACEERPTMTDPETGERVYIDVYDKEHTQDKPWICYNA